MREIKFRAWNILDKHMLFDVDLWNIKYGEIFPHTPDQRCLELMQYTGFKDKNSKEIYEGDYVRFSIFDYNDLDTGYTGYVVWAGSRFMIWKHYDNEYYGSNGGFDLDEVCGQDDEIEVIGNRYENPELLKGGE